MQVLIVEDDYLIALDLAQLVEDLGHQPHLAHDRDAGVRLVEACGFDFALLDLNLGEEDSVPVADRLREQGVTLVFLTGAERGVLPERYRATPILSKPCAVAELRRALETAGNPAET